MAINADKDRMFGTRLLLLLLLPAAAMAAPGRVADILEDQRVNGFHSPASAIEDLQSASDVPSDNAPLDLRRRYYFALGTLSIAAKDRAVHLTALARLEAMVDRENCRPCRVDALLLRADAAQARGDTSETRRHVLEVAPLISADDFASRVRLGDIRARVSHAKGNLVGAVEYAVPAQALAERIGNRADQVRLMVLLVSINADLGHVERATEIADEAVVLAESMGYSDALGFLRMNQGHIHSLTGQRDKQFEALSAALAIVEGDPGLAGIEVTSRSNLADYYLYEGNFDAALAHASRAAELARSIGDERGLVVSTANEGIAMSRLGDVSGGIDKLEESVALAEKIGHSGYVVGITHELVQVLEQNGRYREALAAMHKIAAINQEITRQEREKEVLEIQEKYESESKSREIERLSAENLIKQAEVAARAWKQRLWAALAVVLALAATLLVQWLSYSRKQNRNLRDRNASLADETIHDPLTGAFNRRHFQQLMEHRAAMPTGHAEDAAMSGTVGLMVLDLDHFKQINDTYGHDTGDAVLVEVVRRLNGLLREPDTVVRWGGEEFVLVLPGMTAAGLPILAGRLLRAVGGEPVRCGNQSVAVTLSVGCVVDPVSPVVPWQDALRLADAAMYRAKESGRNRAICVAGIASESAAASKEEVEVDGVEPVSVSTIIGPASAVRGNATAPGPV